MTFNNGKTIRSLVAVSILALGLSACATKNSANIGANPNFPLNIVEVQAKAETAPVNSKGDAADDPAIWHNGTNPSASKIIGTQKKGGLYVYNLDGTIAQEVMGGKPNNVDIRTGFDFNGEKDAIVGASDRTDNTIVLWRFRESTGKLDPTPIARIKTGFKEVYGFCLGKSGDNFVVAATSKTGDLMVNYIHYKDGNQLSVQEEQFGDIISEPLYRDSFGSIAEGCVINDQNSHLYLSQENVGLWDVDFMNNDKKLIDKVTDGRLVADVEGATIWNNGNKGYIVVSVQGADRFNIYDLEGEHKYRGSFKVTDGAIDGVSGTDGLDISAQNFGADYPNGLVVTQDDINTMPDATQNFKLISWQDIATKLGLE